MLPRAIATRAAFENAVALDVAMGGSTNTVLHLLAAAREAEVDFGVADIDAISRRVPCLSKVAPNTPKYHMEDVHRAGGIPAILGELDRGGLLHRDVHTVHAPSLASWLAEWDVRGGSASPAAVELFHAAPGGVRTTEPFSTTNRWSTLDLDAADGCIRDVAHAYSADGGLAILHGNLAPEGCVVKTAGVPDENLRFTRPGPGLRVAGRHGGRHPARRRGRGRRRRGALRGAAGRPGHAGDALPHVVPQGTRTRAGRARSSPTAGSPAAPAACRSGTSRPRRPAAGSSPWSQDGDEIAIDIPARTVTLNVPADELEARRIAQEKRDRPYTPVNRERYVSAALRAYASMATSASDGAYRRVPD